MEKKHRLGQRYAMGYSNQQMDAVSSSSGTKDWQGRVVADANEIHRNRFAQCVREQVTLFLGAEDAVDLSARIGMTHRFQHSLQLNVPAVPVTLGAHAARESVRFRL